MEVALVEAGKITYTIAPFQSTLYYQSLALRYLVLRKPLNLFFSVEELKTEKDEITIIAILNTLVVSTLSIKVTNNIAKIRQVATIPNLQGTGIGKELNKFAELHLKSVHVNEINLHARLTAQQFYTKLNYQSIGSIFTEVGIPHLKMIKSI